MNSFDWRLAFLGQEFSNATLDAMTVPRPLLGTLTQAKIGSRMTDRRFCLYFTLLFRMPNDRGSDWQAKMLEGN